jgi:hypothetical protein
LNPLVFSGGNARCVRVLVERERYSISGAASLDHRNLQQASLAIVPVRRLPNPAARNRATQEAFEPLAERFGSVPRRILESGYRESVWRLS